jgi:hypothetical protein
VNRRAPEGRSFSYIIEDHAVPTHGDEPHSSAQSGRRSSRNSSLVLCRCHSSLSANPSATPWRAEQAGLTPGIARIDHDFLGSVTPPGLKSSKHRDAERRRLLRGSRRARPLRLVDRRGMRDFGRWKNVCRRGLAPAERPSGFHRHGPIARDAASSRLHCCVPSSTLTLSESVINLTSTQSCALARQRSDKIRSFPATFLERRA